MRTVEEEKAIQKEDGVAKICELVPSGSTAAAFCEHDEDAHDYARKLRRAGICMRRLPLLSCVEEIEAQTADDDVRLVLAIGGNAAADCAKRYAKKHDLPLFAVVCSPCALRVPSPYATLYDGGVLRPVQGVSPAGYALASDALRRRCDELPSAFGELMTAALCLFDREACLRACGKALPPSVRESVFDSLYDALSVAAREGRESERLPEKLAQTALAVATSMATLECGGVYGSAESCARTAHMLFLREERPFFALGEAAFLFGSVLCRVFCAFADAPAVFTPPPDNNLRAEKLTEYLGLDDMTAARAAMSKLPNAPLAQYRLHEYRDELSELAADTRRLFDEAKRTFRRLYADDGFSLRGRLDASDVRLVLALAPDLFPACDSALTLLRNLGQMDKYL